MLAGRQLARPQPAAARAAGRPALRPVPIATRAVKEKEVEVEVDEDVFSDGPDAAPSTQEIQQMLSTLVDDTEIAEMELKTGTFSMRVRRSVEGTEPAVAPMAAAAPVHAPVAAAPAQAAAPAAGGDEPQQYESVDESTICVTAPKVGVFRRGRYAGGKKIGKGNAANVGDQVKRGQTLGYIEQLGTFVEVKAPQAGEILAYKADEGDPVEYGGLVVELAPFFGGHIIGDSKYA